jgi:hypothetical protein
VTTTTLARGLPPTSAPGFVPPEGNAPTTAPPATEALTTQPAEGVSVLWAILIFLFGVGGTTAMIGYQWWRTR